MSCLACHRVAVRHRTCVVAIGANRAPVADRNCLCAPLLYFTMHRRALGPSQGNISSLNPTRAKNRHLLCYHTTQSSIAHDIFSTYTLPRSLEITAGLIWSSAEQYREFEDSSGRSILPRRRQSWSVTATDDLVRVDTTKFCRHVSYDLSAQPCWLLLSIAQSHATLHT